MLSSTLQTGNDYFLFAYMSAELHKRCGEAAERERLTERGDKEKAGEGKESERSKNMKNVA